MKISITQQNLCLCKNGNTSLEKPCPFCWRTREWDGRLGETASMGNKRLVGPPKMLLQQEETHCLFHSSDRETKDQDPEPLSFPKPAAILVYILPTATLHELFFADTSWLSAIFLDAPVAPVMLHRYHSTQVLPRWWLQMEPDFVTDTSFLYSEPLVVILME